MLEIICFAVTFLFSIMIDSILNFHFYFLNYIFPTIVFIVSIIIIYFNWSYNYWKHHHLPFNPPIFPYGNIKEIINEEKTFGQAVGDVYKKFKSKGHMHAGYFLLHQPIYVPIDLNVIKHILQIDFNHFMDHGTYYNEKQDPLSAHLFSIEGEKWKNLRVKLTPTFTSGKMKMMFPIMVDISEKLIQSVQNGGLNKVEVKSLAVRFTTDIIGCCAFGIDCNSLEDPNAEFCVQGKRVFTMTRLEWLRSFVCFICPNFSRFIGLRFLPKGPTSFFWNIIKNNAELREESEIRRNDFFQLLLDLKNGDEKLSFQELAAQAFLFFAAGYETSSLTLSLALYELSKNEEVQNKLREDVLNVIKKYDGVVTYEGLNEMEYLDKVVKETLRKYPPLPLLNRICTQDYHIPNSQFLLKKGLKIFVPIEKIHYDPEFYPNPDIFDPDRFTEENVNKRPHFSYLPFGEGPRICIGMRFGMMQTKIGLVGLIKNFKMRTNPDTESIQMNTRHILNIPLKPIWVDFETV
ncbi:probable cytochrome P450 6a17 [Onthophagus taurus]|uniref:probable cytochrome P450 6a17 n=1 Tax=Onthophagus taurus TaxID=166361 RepID=UPI0039BE38C0